ncbi:hypothetical protein OEZ86_012798 [Tetradesmus obliquus]|nr:hypothetical protein OEZ86_012798 [Tetradesmus obliquus]
MIPLAAADRSIGLCTDAALYMQLLGAWVVPVYAPNFEQVFGYDREAHMRMQLVLCKVQRCQQLMQQYLNDIGSSAQLLYTGHTSLDPLAFSPQHQQLRTASRAAGLQQPGSSSSSSSSNDGAASMPLAAAAEPLAALHVRGKSSLKHTKQLLDCWLSHPEWPRLTVVGPFPNEQVSLQMTKEALAAGNIAMPRPGKAAGPGWPQFDPLPQGDMSALLLSHALHIIPSEREGFGHSINEGRAAGAVLLVPDHPPMNELVRQSAGLLMRPAAVFSHADDPVPVLGKYGNISASMSPQDICGAVSRALQLSQQERLAMGRRARQLFEADRRPFEQQMAQLPALLRRLAGAAAADGQRVPQQ